MAQDQKRSREKLIEVITGLIALAMSTNFEPEREAALTKADKLMEEYAIELTDLNTGNSSDPGQIGISHETVWFGEPGKIPTEIRQWKVLLAYAVGEYTFCTILTHKGSSGILVIGHDGDRQLFKQVWTQIVESIKKLMEESAAEARKRGVFKKGNPSFTDPLRWRKVYLEQIALWVALRLQKMHDQRLARLGKLVPYTQATEDYTKRQFPEVVVSPFRLADYDQSPDAALTARIDSEKVTVGIQEINSGEGQ